jgi:D-arabinose 1-dehydrogenase-like Zn-dependent alcohol dehydrogenase
MFGVFCLLNNLVLGALGLLLNGYGDWSLRYIYQVKISVPCVLLSIISSNTNPHYTLHKHFTLLSDLFFNTSERFILSNTQVKMVEFTTFKGSKEGKIVESKTTKEVGPDEVLIKVTHSGLCGTDEHYKCADMVLGHEGAGVIEVLPLLHLQNFSLTATQEVGSSVKTYTKGDRVGWGYQHSSCGHCKQCLTGHETLCPERAMYGYADQDQGSFAHYAVWKADYIFAIPSSIATEHAAPLMCGGATVFNALQSFGTKPTDRVGVIGIGGLGHLAIQFAAKMGCEVVVFSSTDSKKDEAFKLGATEFVATKNVKDLAEKVARPIDTLLVTTSVQPDWKQFLPIMAPGATIFPLTVSADDLTIPYMPILAGELKIQGSLVAARQVHREMLVFAAHHGIKPIIEVFPMTQEGITECMEKLEKGGMRYRGVLAVQ